MAAVDAGHGTRFGSMADHSESSGPSRSVLLHGPTLAAPGGGIAAPELWLDTVRNFTIEAMMTEIRADLRTLGIEQEVFSSERALTGAGAGSGVTGAATGSGV